MKTITKNWAIGGGYITLTYEGEGDGTIAIISTANTGEERSMVVNVRTTDGKVLRSIKVHQDAAEQTGIKVNVKMYIKYDGIASEVQIHDVNDIRTYAGEIVEYVRLEAEGAYFYEEWLRLSQHSPKNPWGYNLFALSTPADYETDGYYNAWFDVDGCSEDMQPNDFPRSSITCSFPIAMEMEAEDYWVDILGEHNV